MEKRTIPVEDVISELKRIYDYCDFDRRAQDRIAAYMDALDPIEHPDHA